MMEEDDTKYMDELQEWIFDKRQVVTFKYLADKLGVSSNRAKQMLYTFMTERDRESNLQALYLISGIFKETQEHRVEVAPETRIKKYLTIYSYHIYSLHYCQNDTNIELSVLFDIDKTIDKAPQSIIHCKEATLRSKPTKQKNKQKLEEDDEKENKNVQDEEEEEEEEEEKSEDEDMMKVDKNVKQEKGSKTAKAGSIGVKKEKTDDEPPAKESKQDKAAAFFKPQETKSKSSTSSTSATKKKTPPTKSSKPPAKKAKMTQQNIKSFFTTK